MNKTQRLINLLTWKIMLRYTYIPWMSKIILWNAPKDRIQPTTKQSKHPNNLCVIVSEGHMPVSSLSKPKLLLRLLILPSNEASSASLLNMRSNQLRFPKSNQSSG